jgi:hypothetical protein
MNVDILADGTYGTLAHYFAFAVPLTAITVWVIMAFQYRKKDPSHLIHDENYVSVWDKFSWPWTTLRRKLMRTRSGTVKSGRTLSRPASKAFDPNDAP